MANLDQHKARAPFYSTYREAFLTDFINDKGEIENILFDVEERDLKTKIGTLTYNETTNIINFYGNVVEAQIRFLPYFINAVEQNLKISIMTTQENEFVLFKFHDRDKPENIFSKVIYNKDTRSINVTGNMTESARTFFDIFEKEFNQYCKLLYIN